MGLSHHIGNTLSSPSGMHSHSRAPTAFMGRSEGRLQSPGGSRQGSGLLAARPASTLYAGAHEACQALQGPESLEIWNLFE